MATNIKSNWLNLTVADLNIMKYISLLRMCSGKFSIRELSFNSYTYN